MILGGPALKIFHITLKIKYSKEMKKLLAILFSAAACTASNAADYSLMYVFGDSYSDVGNYSVSQSPSRSPYAYEGRWSNGKLWNEYLAEKLGMNAPTISKEYMNGDSPEEGQNNFAYAGARSEKNNSSEIPTVYEEIHGLPEYEIYLYVGFDRYGVNFSENDLVLVWGGINDVVFWDDVIFEGYESSDYGRESAQNMAKRVHELINMGAKNLVVLNLPNLAHLPIASEGVQWRPVWFEEGTQAFNETFANEINALVETYKDEGVQITQVDIFTLFNSIMNDPRNYGFEDTESELIVALEENGDLDQDKYLFFDEMHLTTAGHKVIADAVYDAMTVPEPSTYAAVFGVLALAFASCRRRK